MAKLTQQELRLAGPLVGIVVGVVLYIALGNLAVAIGVGTGLILLTRFAIKR